jgi:hypothetical protein
VHGVTVEPSHKFAIRVSLHRQTANEPSNKVFPIKAAFASALVNSDTADLCLDGLTRDNLTFSAIFRRCKFQNAYLCAFFPSAIRFLADITNLSCNHVRASEQTSLHRRLFGLENGPGLPDLKSVKLVLEQPQKGFPRIEISLASEIFGVLLRFPPRPRLSLKLVGCGVARHDEAVSLLKKVAGSVFFQIDLLTDVPLVL